MRVKEETKNNIPIAVIGISHKTADIKIREMATFSEEEQKKIIQQLSKKFNTRGSIVLSTCNRTEIYFCGRKAIKYISDICLYLDAKKDHSVFSNKQISYIYFGRKAIHHFFRVITSLDSQLIGEPQITGQVKTAYEKSHRSNHTDILLNKMYNIGMQAEKQVRSKTHLAGGAVSISFAGVELARKIFGDLQNSIVLLIGAGETAELAALHFANRGVSRLLVINRTYKKSVSLAEKIKATPLPMSELNNALLKANIVISATSSESPVIGKKILEEVAAAREYKPIFLIDLAIPRDIDPTAKGIDGVFLYNLDSLEEIVNNNILKRQKDIPKAEKIVNEYVSAYLKWYNTLPVVKTITKLSRCFEEIRAQEFERLKNRFPENSLEEIEYLSKSLMKKFLHHHIMSLRKTNSDPKRQQQHIGLVDEIYHLNGRKKKGEDKNQ